MARKFFSLVIAILLLASCGNKSGKGVSEKLSGTDLAENITFASLIENPGNYIDKNIIVKGVACKSSSMETAAGCETEAALAKQSKLSELMMIYNKHELVK
jgi:hypothetical protein